MPKIVREGWPFILGCLVASDIFLLVSIFFKNGFCVVIAVLFLVATAFCAYFFRDPARLIPAGEHLLLCPADGKVMEVVEGRDAISTEPVWILRIFLSVFDPHLQRSPMAGKVKAIRYKTGKFLDARDPKAAFENEQNRIEIVSDSGAVTLVVTQIAGLIARRIVCWVKEGQPLQAGERIGLIRFGSQVDVVLPKASKVRVKAGDVVTAGSTVLAEL
jgi:phosphatidylserine decarboxylase